MKTVADLLRTVSDGQLLPLLKEIEERMIEEYGQEDEATWEQEEQRYRVGLKNLRQTASDPTDIICVIEVGDDGPTDFQVMGVDPAIHNPLFIEMLSWEQWMAMPVQAAPPGIADSKALAIIVYTMLLNGSSAAEVQDTRDEVEARLEYCRRQIAAGKPIDLEDGFIVDEMRAKNG